MAHIISFCFAGISTSGFLGLTIPGQIAFLRLVGVGYSEIGNIIKYGKCDAEAFSGNVRNKRPKLFYKIIYIGQVMVIHSNVTYDIVFVLQEERTHRKLSNAPHTLGVSAI